MIGVSDLISVAAEQKKSAVCSGDVVKCTTFGGDDCLHLL